MITEGRLRDAAARTCEEYISGLLAGYDPEYRCEFSPGFERKIDRLKRRADHPVFYRTMRRVAMLLLALLVAGTVWIAVDADARAAFFGWAGNFIGGYYVFHHEAEPDGGAAPDREPEAADYRPGWIPEGYAESAVNVLRDKTTVLYVDAEGEYLRFSYLRSQGNDDWFFGFTGGEVFERSVNGRKAALFLSETEGVSNLLTWSLSDTTAANITGFLSEAELLRMAESVRRIN